MATYNSEEPAVPFSGQQTRVQVPPKLQRVTPLDVPLCENRISIREFAGTKLIPKDGYSENDSEP